jgi:hypothetical protein
VNAQEVASNAIVLTTESPLWCASLIFGTNDDVGAFLLHVDSILEPQTCCTLLTVTAIPQLKALQ